MKLKSQQIKIYDRNLNELALENNAKNTPTWKWETGKGQMDSSLELNYPFDDIPSYVQSNNIVKVREISVDNPRGVDAYTGIIGTTKPRLDGGLESVDVELLGPNSMLMWSNYTTASGGTTVTVTARDIGNVFKDIIDHWQNVHSSTLISYSSTSISMTTVSITTNLVDLKHGDALNEVFKFADADWYWYLDNNGTVYLQELPTSATHTFTVGKDVAVSDIEQDYKGIINKQTVFYNGGNVTITSSASIAQYGLHEGKYIRDTNIQNVGTATARATQVVVANKDPKITGSVKVTSEFTDLPNIRVGDTLKLKNYNASGSMLNDNMPIVSVQYDWDSATLELGEIKSNFARELNNLITQLQ